MQKKKTSHPASLKITLRAAKKIIPIFKDEKVRISFYGGEPLIHPALLDIVKLYRDELNNNRRLMAQTNGSRNISFFRKLFAIDPTFHINNSVHLEYVDESELFEKIELFCGDGRKPKINVMFLPRYRDKAKRICEKLLLKSQNLSFKFDISLIRSPESNFKDLLDEYSEIDLLWRDEMLMEFEHKQNVTNSDPVLFIDFLTDFNKILRLKTCYSEAMRYKLLSFKGMTCLPGRRLIIDENGLIKMPCEVKRAIRPNVYGEDLSEINFLKPVKCPKLNCLCKADVTSPKYITDEYSPKYIQDTAYLEEPIEDIEPISIDQVLRKKLA
jgi:hypothetical protein